MLFRLLPSELAALRVGIPLTKGWSVVVLEVSAGSIDALALGELGVSLRRALVGVEGPAGASAGAEATGGLLMRPLPVFTGVPEVMVESPSRRTRRERGVAPAAAAGGAVGPLSDSALLAFCT